MTDELAAVVAAEVKRRAEESALALRRATVTEIRIARIMGSGSADANGYCKHCGLELAEDGDGNWLHLPIECGGPPATCVCGAPIRFKGLSREMFNLNGTAHDCAVWKRGTASETLPYVLRRPSAPRRTYDD